MANRFPLIFNTDANQIQELAASNNIDLTSSGIANAVSIGATSINVTGVSTLGNVVIGGATTSLLVQGNARIIGILSVGQGTIIFNGDNNQINVGSGITLSHTNGIYVGSSNITSNGLSISNVNASGIVTASSFVGSITGTASTASFATTSFGLAGSPNITVGNINSSGIVTASSFGGNASSATYATSAGIATYATSAGIATYATSAGIATIATYASNAGIATYATSAGIATYATSAGIATSTTNIPNLTGDISSVNTATTLATVNSNVGTFGGTGAIPVVTVNGKGLVTGVTTVAPNNGTLTLATSGTGLSGSASFAANQSGESSFTVTSNATNSNNASTIVARDGSGNFSAGTITATLTGNASSATYTSEWILGANGSSDYTFTGPGLIGAENDITLYLIRGQQYKFTNTMGQHPFRIQSTVNGSTGTQYNDGIVNNDVSNGTLTWNVQFDAPGLLYYQCTAHAGMGGKIYIIDAGIGPDISINTTGTITASSFSGNASSATSVSGSTSNGYGTRTVQSGGSPSGGSDGDIYYIY